MNSSPTTVITAPWVRVSEYRYVHRSGATMELKSPWKRTELWVGVIAIAIEVMAAWFLFRAF